MNLTTTTDASGADSVTWVIHGKAGSGKTSMLGTVPDPSRLLYVNLEGGIIPPSLRGAGAVQAAWDMLECSAEDYMRQVYRYVRGDGRDLYDWIAVDSLSALAEDVLARCMAANKDGRAAYGDMADAVKALVRAYRALPINVVFICKHALVDQPDGEGKLAVPNLPGNQLKQWLPHEVDGIFAMILNTRGKGEKEETIRYLRTFANGRYEAKDRSGMLDRIERPDLAVMHNKVMRGLAPKETTA